MSKETGGPAFPTELTNYGELNMIIGGVAIPPGAMMQFPGMTLRDAFAYGAMVGLMASFAGIPGARFPTPETISSDAYAQADAMLAERAKP